MFPKFRELTPAELEQSRNNEEIESNNGILTTRMIRRMSVSIDTITVTETSNNLQGI